MEDMKLASRSNLLQQELGGLEELHRSSLLLDEDGMIEIFIASTISGNKGHQSGLQRGKARVISHRFDIGTIVYVPCLGEQGHSGW
jgi:hypothetical protein